MYIYPLAWRSAERYNKPYNDNVQGAFSMKQKLKDSFLYAFQRSMPIMIGYFALGSANGILMAQKGYSVGLTGIASLFIYAGTQQMLLSGWLAAGTPILTIAITSLLLNSRHLFFGISFLEKFKEYGPWKYFLIYGLTDESYSLLCSYIPRDDVEEKWVHIFDTALIWSYWILFSMFGCLAGTLLPFDMTGVDFAMTALFIVILINQLEHCESKLPAAVSFVSALACLLIFGPDNFLLPSLAATVVALIAFQGRLEGKVRVE